MVKVISEKVSENEASVLNGLVQIVKPLFLKGELVDNTIKVLKFIKKKSFVSSAEIIRKCSLTKSQWYDTILPALKKSGLIHKRSIYYELDSQYSLNNIKNAQIWIRFAEIKKSQPEKIKQALVELMM